MWWTVAPIHFLTALQPQPLPLCPDTFSYSSAASAITLLPRYIFLQLCNLSHYPYARYIFLQLCSLSHYRFTPIHFLTALQPQPLPFCPNIFSYSSAASAITLLPRYIFLQLCSLSHYTFHRNGAKMTSW